MALSRLFARSEKSYCKQEINLLSSKIQEEIKKKGEISHALFKNHGRKEKERTRDCVYDLCAALLAYSTVNFAFATSYKNTISSLVEQLIGIIGTIFIAIGVILTAYSVGQLILAFKNEDADSKSRATTMLVVAVVLIAAPSIIKSLDLVSKITS